jgi:hypothetical protein
MFSINYTLDKNSAIIMLGLFTAACAFIFLKKGIDFIICGNREDKFTRLKGLGLTGVAVLLFLGGLTTVLESEKIGKILSQTIAEKMVNWLNGEQPTNNTKKHKRHKELR